MTNTRRDFLKSLTGLTAGAAACTAFDPAIIPEIEAAAGPAQWTPARELARDERFWFTVRKAFAQSSSFINLESGWFNPTPTDVLEAEIGYMHRVNAITSFYLRRQDLWPRERIELKRFIGEFAGCSPEEFVISRNTTEALDTIIQGLELEPDDELLYSDRDYPSMHHAIEQRAERYGLQTRIIKVPLVPESDDQVIRVYEGGITPRTRVMLVTHMINLTGQILPVRAICDMAHAHGVEVIVDAAHTFAHIEYAITDLHCDYLGTSLHKWLGAPLGTGLMYVRQEKIPRVWPLFGDRTYGKDDIRKFEHIGTHPVTIDLGIRDAIRFHRSIGGKRKEERLRYLKNYWVQQVVDRPRVRINTPLGDHESCAIANLAIEGMTPKALEQYLFDRHRVFTVAVDVGIRVSPNLFNTLDDLDALVQGVRELTA